MPTELFGYLVEEQWMSSASKILGGLLMVIPGVLLTILGVKCFWNSVKVSKAVIFGFVAIWFIALFAIIGITVSTASKFRSSVEMTDDKVLNIPSDTLQVQFLDKEEGNYRYSGFNDLEQLIDENGNLVIPIYETFDIEESNDNNIHLEVRYSSKGGSKEEAKRNLESIKYSYKLEGNKLNLDKFVKIPKNGKFREQTVDIKIYVPKNKVVFVRKSNSVNIRSGQYDTDYVNDINNNYFGYNGKKFVCLNCQKDEDSDNENSNQDEDLNINIQDENDSAKVIIDKNGFRIESKDKTVGVGYVEGAKSKNEKNNQQINYKDDTDSININYRNHQNNR